MFEDEEDKKEYLEQLSSLSVEELQQKFKATEIEQNEDIIATNKLKSNLKSKILKQNKRILELEIELEIPGSAELSSWDLEDFDSMTTDDVPDGSVEELQNRIKKNDEKIANYEERLQSIMIEETTKKQDELNGLISELSELDSESAEEIRSAISDSVSGASPSKEQYQTICELIGRCNEKLKSLLISRIMKQQEILNAQYEQMDLYSQREYL